MRIKKIYLSLISILLFDTFLITFLLLTSKGLIFFIGTNWRPYTPIQLGFDLIRSAWIPTNFGSPNTIPDMTVLTIVFLQSIIPNKLIAQVALFFAPYWIASFSMILLLYKLNVTRSPLILTLSALVYAYNWVTVLQCGNLLLLYPYATIPLVIFFSARIFMENTKPFRNAIGLALSLVAGAFPYMPVALIFLSPFVLVGIIYGILNQEKHERMSSLLKSIVTCALSVLYFVVLTIPFSILPIAGGITHGILGYSSAAGFHVQSNLVAYISPGVFKYYLPSDISAFGILVSPQQTSTILWLFSFIIPIIALSVFFRSRGKTAKLGWAIGLVYGFFYALTLVILNQTNTVQFLYSRVPVLIPFNGFSVYTIMLGSPLAILFALGISSIDDRVRLLHGRTVSFRQFSIQYISVIVTAILIVAALLPLTSSNLFFLKLNHLNETEMNAAPQFGNESNYLPVLVHYFDGLRSEYGGFRVLYLPGQYLLNQMLQNLDPSSNFAIAGFLNNQALLSTLQIAVELMNSSYYSGQTIGSNSNISDLGSLFAELGFKYVVVLRDVSVGGDIGMNLNSTDIYISGAPSRFMNVFYQEQDLLMTNLTEQYAIFQNLAYPRVGINGLFWTFGGAYVNATMWPPANNSLKVVSQFPEYSPSIYSIQVTSSKPSWLFFAENYDPGWKAVATLPNGTSLYLDHVYGNGWANAFLIPISGNIDIRVIYVPQQTYNSILILWIIGSGIIMLTFLCVDFNVVARIRKGVHFHTE